MCCAAIFISAECVSMLFELRCWPNPFREIETKYISFLNPIAGRSGISWSSTRSHCWQRVIHGKKHPDSRGFLVSATYPCPSKFSVFSLLHESAISISGLGLAHISLIAFSQIISLIPSTINTTTFQNCESKIESVHTAVGIVWTGCTIRSLYTRSKGRLISPDETQIFVLFCVEFFIHDWDIAVWKTYLTSLTWSTLFSPVICTMSFVPLMNKSESSLKLAQNSA